MNVKEWEKENKIVAYKWNYVNKPFREFGINERGDFIKLPKAKDSYEEAEIVKPKIDKRKKK